MLRNILCHPNLVYIAPILEVRKLFSLVKVFEYKFKVWTKADFFDKLVIGCSVPEREHEYPKLIYWQWFP